MRHERAVGESAKIIDLLRAESFIRRGSRPKTSDDLHVFSNERHLRALWEVGRFIEDEATLSYVSPDSKHRWNPSMRPNARRRAELFAAISSPGLARASRSMTKPLSFAFTRQARAQNERSRTLVAEEPSLGVLLEAWRPLSSSSSRSNRGS